MDPGLQCHCLVHKHTEDPCRNAKLEMIQAQV